MCPFYVRMYLCISVHLYLRLMCQYIYSAKTNRLWAQITFVMAEYQENPNNSLRAVANVPKFDGNNYREWSYELDLAFQQLEIISIIDGTDLLPDEVKLFKSLSI